MKYLHTMVRVTDLEESLDFYCNKLGLEDPPADADNKFDAGAAVALHVDVNNVVARSMRMPLGLPALTSSASFTCPDGVSTVPLDVLQVVRRRASGR